MHIEPDNNTPGITWIRISDLGDGMTHSVNATELLESGQQHERIEESFKTLTVVDEVKGLATPEGEAVTAIAAAYLLGVGTGVMLAAEQMGASVNLMSGI